MLQNKYISPRQPICVIITYLLFRLFVKWAREPNPTPADPTLVAPKLSARVCVVTNETPEQENRHISRAWSSDGVNAYALVFRPLPKCRKRLDEFRRKIDSSEQY